MADEDIFKLTFEPNTDEVEQALIEMGKNVDRLVDIGLKGMEGSFQRQIADIAKMKDGPERERYGKLLSQAWDSHVICNATMIRSCSAQLRLARSRAVSA